MNYTKRGIRAQEHAILTGGGRLYKKAGLILANALLIAVVTAVIAAAGLGIGAFRGILSSSPEIDNLSVTPKGMSSFVYDLEGNQIAKLVATDSNRIPVTMDMIPKDLCDAYVAIEDERFYEHNGIDIHGIIRAAFRAVQTRRLSQGASTITQQLLKNNVFTDWVGQSGMAKIKRKIQEQFLAVELEKRMSKEDILLNYMNTINLGHNTLGVQAASLRYFGKSVSDLNLSECACIAGITQNPSANDPIIYPENNDNRRKLVLGNMLDQNLITQEEYEKAMNDDVYARIQIIDAETSETSVNSYFVDALTEELEKDLVAAGYNETQAYTLLYSSGLRIFSTQDPKIQRIADEIYADPANYPEYTPLLLNYALTVKKADGSLENHSQEMFQQYFKQFDRNYSLLYASEEKAREAIEQYKAEVLQDGDEVFDERTFFVPQPQVSLTVADQRTGYVVAIIGGRGQKTASRTLNRATDSTRQPGSTFKVVSTYAPALDSYGMTLATTINDAPYAYDNGTLVRNWWGATYRGLTSLRQGIVTSANVVTVKTLTWITPQLGWQYLKNFGFTTLVESENIGGEIYSDIQQSMALGGLTRGVTNLELNASYAAIANGGTYIRPKLYTKVLDHNGNVLLDNTQPETRQVLKPTTAYLLTSAMEDVITAADGTGKSVNFGTTAIAGKTGTTTDDRDVWFAGYSNYYTATTWTGYDNNAKLNSSTGDTNLSRGMWRKVMEKIHEGLPRSEFERPPGIVTLTVCGQSGKLPIPGRCNAHLKTEMFAEDTQPTETCDVHYSGDMCGYSGLPASTQCPFRVHGVYNTRPVEPPQVQKGSGNTGAVEVTVNEDGRETVSRMPCSHNDAFWQQANVAAVVAQQYYSMLLKNGYPQDDSSLALAAQFGFDAQRKYQNGQLVSGYSAPVSRAGASAPAEEAETPAAETPAVPPEGENLTEEEAAAAAAAAAQAAAEAAAAQAAAQAAAGASDAAAQGPAPSADAAQPIPDAEPEGDGTEIPAAEGEG